MTLAVEDLDDCIRSGRTIDASECRPDQPRPTFTEDGYDRSSTATGRRRTRRQAATSRRSRAFFARLIPDEAERTWMWHWLAHKARRPWVPMVAVIMVAEEFGSGRGTLFDILELVFGKDYVVPCSFGELTGKVARGALQRPARRRAVRRRQRGGRRGRAPADASAGRPTTPEECRSNRRRRRGGASSRRTSMSARSGQR